MSASKLERYTLMIRSAGKTSIDREALLPAAGRKEAEENGQGEIAC